MRFVVIENTPGYLPDDDDPFETDDYAEAVEFMNERAQEYADDPDGNYRVEYGIASADNYAAVMIWDDDKTHDLGRSIQVLRVEEQPCEWFAGCLNPATGTTPHPVLGDVPTCDRCDDFASS